MPDDTLPEVRLDVSGMSMAMPEVVCEADSIRLRYVVDPALKRGSRFHFGLFFSKAVHSEDVHRYPRAQRAAVLTESPIDACYRDIPAVARRFPLVFTHQRDLLEQGAPFVPLMFGTNWLAWGDAELEALRPRPADKSGMVSFIGSLEHPNEGAYRFRREVAEYLVGRGDVACYGRGIRAVGGKHEAIAPYRFSIAMENAASDHYFSEKLIDCLLLDTVPIYYGCPAIGSLFDARGMLQFRDVSELREIVDGLDEARYLAMLPFVQANRRKAIAERWHSHRGLFERITDRLAGAANGCDALPFRSATRVSRFVSRVRAALVPGWR